MCEETYLIFKPGLTLGRYIYCVEEKENLGRYHGGVLCKWRPRKGETAERLLYDGKVLGKITSWLTSLVFYWPIRC